MRMLEMDRLMMNTNTLILYVIINISYNYIFDYFDTKLNVLSVCLQAFQRV